MASTEPGRGPRWTWQWGLLLLGGLLVMEGVTRIEDRVAAGIPMFSRVSGPGDLIWVDSIGARGRPNARYRQWSLNARGFRGPEIADAPAPGVARVVTVGASETFGLYESPGHEWPRQLEDSLRARGCQVEVVNAALPGMALPSMAQLLDRIVRTVHPTHLVLYPSPAFYLNRNAPIASRGVAGADSTLPWRRALAWRSRERAVAQVKGLLPSPAMTAARRFSLSRRNPARTARTVPEGRLQQLDHDLREVVGVARSLGAPVLLAGHVNATMAPGFDDPGMLVAWEYQFPAVTGEVLMAFHRAARDVAVTVARDSALAYVDLADALAGGWEGSFADFVHFTDAGASRVSHTLATALAPALCATGEVGR